MSALPPKADIVQQDRDVSFVPISCLQPMENAKWSISRCDAVVVVCAASPARFRRPPASALSAIARTAGRLEARRRRAPQGIIGRIRTCLHDNETYQRAI